MASNPEDRDGRALEWTKVVLLPLVTLVISIVGSWYFTNLSKERETRATQQAQVSETRESKQRLYAQLLTQREQSDATIRKDMFEVVLGRFLSDRQQGNLSDQVLQLGSAARRNFGPIPAAKRRSNRAAPASPRCA